MRWSLVQYYIAGLLHYVPLWLKCPVPITQTFNFLSVVKWILITHLYTQQGRSAPAIWPALGLLSPPDVRMEDNRFQPNFFLTIPELAVYLACTNMWANTVPILSKSMCSVKMEIDKQGCWKLDNLGAIDTLIPFSSVCSCWYLHIKTFPFIINSKQSQPF